MKSTGGLPEHSTGLGCGSRISLINYATQVNADLSQFEEHCVRIVKKIIPKI
jgi:hypothetical protein